MEWPKGVKAKRVAEAVYADMCKLLGTVVHCGGGAGGGGGGGGNTKWFKHLFKYQSLTKLEV